MTSVQVKDLVGVSFKGEGLANAVFSFPTSGHHLAGRVLRVQKRAKCGHNTEYGSKKRTPLTDEQERHYEWLISVFIGPEYHQRSIEVGVSREVLEMLSDLMEQNNDTRAKKHRKATEIDLDCPTASLMIDFSLLLLDLPHPSHDLGFSSSLCAEIKPKCGFLPTSRFVQRESKRIHSRHWMYQASKLARGEISQLTHYSPLDLFSQRPSTIRSAIVNLLQVPQNNIKLFWNGNVCFTGEAEPHHQHFQQQQEGGGDLSRLTSSKSSSSSSSSFSRADGSLEASMRRWFALNVANGHENGLQHSHNHQTDGKEEEEAEEEHHHNGELNSHSQPQSLSSREDVKETSPLPSSSLSSPSSASTLLLSPHATSTATTSATPTIDGDLGEGEKMFCDTIASLLSENQVLQRILRMQQLDAFDIEYIWPLYSKIRKTQLVDRFLSFVADFSVLFAAQHKQDISSSLSKEVADELRDELYQSLFVDEDNAERLISLSDDDFVASSSAIETSFKIIFAFLLGSVAKDCSLMIAINTAALPLVSTHSISAHRIATIDFDLKSVYNIPTYFKQDSSIVSNFEAALSQSH